MKAIFLFIIFNLLYSFSSYAMPSCEEAWTQKQKPGFILRSKIFWTNNLKMANLQHMDLQNEYLGWMDLRGADLREADLQWAILRDADLRGANLEGAKLQWADLERADLRGVNLTGVNFQFAKLKRAQVTPEQAKYLKSQGLSGFVVVELE